MTNFQDILSLRGLTPAASQVWRGIRLVPLIRDQPRRDLRMGLKRYDAHWTSVATKTTKAGMKGVQESYNTWVPHGMIVSWTGDETPVATWETRFGKLRDAPEGRRHEYGFCTVQQLHRQVKRIDRQTLRMLPMHLAIEGLVALHFGGPDVAWDYYDARVRRRGFGVNTEWFGRGSQIPGLEAALRLFELHPKQSGVAVFAGDTLASIFVVPDPEDYRRLHGTVLEDFFANFLAYHANLHDDLQTWAVQADGPVESLDDLRRAFEGARREWADWEFGMADALVGRAIDVEPIRRMGPFRLHRFMTSLSTQDSEFVGESIVRQDGTLEYLKTCRLRRDQTRRARLLKALAASMWSLDLTAEALGWTRLMLISELKASGLWARMFKRLQAA